MKHEINVGDIYVRNDPLDKTNNYKVVIVNFNSTVVAFKFFFNIYDNNKPFIEKNEVFHKYFRKITKLEKALV